MKGKSRKEITSNEALKIRSGGNPDRAIAPNAHMRDLCNKSYVEIVQIFRERIYSRYINATSCFDKDSYNFIVIATCCIILDLLSQYRYGSPSSSSEKFMQFFRDYFSQYNHKINPPIISCYFDVKQNKWFEVEINDVAEAFWHCFRNGIVHSTMILEYGRINERYPDEIIKVIPWAEGKKEININTSGFLRLVKEVFDKYVAQLNDGDSEIKMNFFKKWESDFGIKIQDAVDSKKSPELIFEK